MLEPTLTVILALYLGALALAGYRAWQQSGLALPAAVRRFLSVPAYGGEEEIRRLHMLLPLLHQGWLVALAVGLFLAWQWGVRGWPLALLTAWLSAGYLGLYVLLRRGQVRLVSRLLPLVAILIVTLVLTLAQGFHGAAVIAYGVVLVAAALLQSSRAAVFYALLSSALVAGVYALEAAGVLTLVRPDAPAQALAIYLGTFASMALLLRQGAQALEEGRRHTRRLQVLQAEQARQLDAALQVERQRARQLELLNDFARTLTGLNDPPALMRAATRRVGEAFGFEAVALYLVEDDHFRLSAVDGLFAEGRALGAALIPGVGVAGWVAAHDQTCWLERPAADARFVAEPGPALASVVAVPLRLAKSLVGVLEVATTRAGSVDASDVRAIESLADLLVAGLQTSQLFIQLRQRQQLTEALRRVGAAVNATLDLTTVLDTICAETRAAFAADRVEVWLEDWPAPLRRVARHGLLPGSDDAADPADTAAYIDTALRAGRHLVSYLAALSDLPAYRAYFGQAQSLILAPLRKDERVFGALVIAEAARPHRLTAEDAAAAELLAAQVTVAMVNAQLFEAERDQRQLTEILRSASLALSTSLDFDQVMDGLLVQVEQIVPYDAGCVILIEGGWTRHARQRGYDQFGAAVDQATQNITLEVARTPNLAQVIHTGQPLLIADTAHYPGWRPVPGSPYLRAWIGVPIMAQGETLALFSLEKREAGFFTPEHARRLTTLAGQVALALQNARLYAAQRRRSEAQRLLLLAARDLSAGLSQAAVLAAAARHMTDGLQNDGCTIYSWERDQNRLVTLLDYARDHDSRLDPVGNTHALSVFPLTLRVLEARQPVSLALDDPTADPAEVAVMRAFGMGHLLMLPLYNGEEVFGLIEVNRDLGQPPFTDSDLQLAQSLAAQAAVALDNARLHTAVQENLRELNALLKANEALLSTLELEPLLQNILDAAIEAVPSAQKGTVILADESGDHLQIRAVHGYADPRILGLIFSREQGFSGRALRENRPLLIDNVELQIEPELKLVPDSSEMAAIGSAVVVPLAPKGHSEPAYGVISLDAVATHAFTDADLRVLVAFANAAAVAIDNARLHAEVQRLAVTDSLTGLANPRAFDQALLTEFHRASRYGYALSLVIMDIDSFKVFNDTYGHPAGNERLRGIADILRANVRDPDLPVRYGGEEFALLLPHTTKGGALALAERIRVAAEAAAPETLARGGPISGYSLSLGVASYPLDALTIDDLLVAADNAELQAKRGGKNQVVAAPQLPGAPPPD